VPQNKYDLSFNPPVMNAAGMLGFAPGKHSLPLGAFVTNPISLYARKPAQGTRFIPYQGGFLLHTGFPNPGIMRVVKEYARSWAAAQIPIIVHLLAQDKAEIMEMVARLEHVEGITGIEIGIPPDADSGLVHRMGLAALGEFPVILRLPFDAALSTVQAACDSGALLVSMAAPRGNLPDPQGEIIAGRLYGPGILPLALRTIQRWTDIGAAVIGAGGVFNPADVTAMLSAGVAAVQVGPAFWGREFSLLDDK